VIWCLFVASLAYCVAFNDGSFVRVLTLVFWTILVDFLFVGVIVATIGWWASNKYLRLYSGSTNDDDHLAGHSVVQSVEWLYAFDIHCNSFFPLFILLYVVQYMFIPGLYTTNFFAILLSNTLYLVAFGYYSYITFLGYTALPFLQNTQTLLYPFGLIIIAYFLALIFRFNATVFVINLYFGSTSAVS